MADQNDKKPDKYFSSRPNTKKKLKSISKKRPVVQKTTEVQKKPPKRKTKLIFLVNSRYSLANPKSLAVTIIGVFVLIFIFIWAFTNKNAYEVYMDQTLIGTIKMDKDVSKESLFNMAVAKLSAETGTNVQVEQKISFKPVHASKKNISSVDHILGQMYDEWIYNIEASVISVDEVELGNLKTTDEANSVLDSMAKQYVKEGTKLIGKPEFIEDVKITKKYVKPDALTTTENALKKLNATKGKESIYTVVSGDILFKIAKKNAVSKDSIVAANPGIDPGSLNIGQKIKITTQVPIVSVKTTEEQIYIDIKEKPIENRENPNEYKTYSKVIQKGHDGKREVTVHVIRINGFEQEKVEVSEKIIEEPLAEIIEIGTSQTPSVR